MNGFRHSVQADLSRHTGCFPCAKFELQYFGKFNEIFVLSMLILATNLIVKGLLTVLAKKKISVKKEKKEMITKGEAIV